MDKQTGKKKIIIKFHLAASYQVLLSTRERKVFLARPQRSFNTSLSINIIIKNKGLKELF